METPGKTATQRNAERAARKAREARKNLPSATIVSVQTRALDAEVKAARAARPSLDDDAAISGSLDRRSDDLRKMRG